MDSRKNSQKKFSNSLLKKKGPKKMSSEILTTTTKNTTKYININYGIVTYKTHINKADLTAFFKGEFRINEIYVAHERSDAEMPYDHTHVVFSCDRTKINPAIKLNYKGIHPNIKVVKVTKLEPFQHAINYIANPEKPGGDPDMHKYYIKVEKNLAVSIWKCKDIKEALEKHMTRPGDAMGIKTCFEQKGIELPNEIPCPWPELKEFQVEMKETVEKKNFKLNQVTWYQDTVGNRGKSQFFIWLCRLKLVHYMEWNNSPKHRMNDVMNAIKRGWNRNIIVVNIARKQSFDSVYPILEQLMNGYISTGMYDAQSVDFGKPCKVIVCSNFMPELEALSAGRWDIRKIGVEDKTVINDKITAYIQK